MKGGQDCQVYQYHWLVFVSYFNDVSHCFHIWDDDQLMGLMEHGLDGEKTQEFTWLRAQTLSEYVCIIIEYYTMSNY